MRYLVTFLLVAVNIALAGLLAQKWLDPRSYQLKQAYWAEPAPVRPSKDSMAVIPVQLAALEISDLVVTTQRPLFFFTRKPPAPPPPPVVPPPQPPQPPPPPPDPLASVELYGLISLGEGKGSVVAKIGGAMRQLKFGEKIGDWTLKEVVGRDAVFAGVGEKERRITMGYRSLQQLGAVSANAGKPAASPNTNTAPSAPLSYDQQVLERRERINKARINAGLKPFDTW